jgi:hypothetical protein
VFSSSSPSLDGLYVCVSPIERVKKKEEEEVYGRLLLA